MRLFPNLLFKNTGPQIAHEKHLKQKVKITEKNRGGFTFAIDWITYHTHLFVDFDLGLYTVYVWISKVRFYWIVSKLRAGSAVIVQDNRASISCL